jgi:hypothetical protein
MANVVHKTLKLGENHSITVFSFADATARLAASFTADDVQKVAYQVDTKTLWFLAGVAPVKWIGIDGVNTGDLTIGAVGAPSAEGAVLAGQVLSLTPADATHPGILTIGDWLAFNTGSKAYDILFSFMGSPSNGQVMSRIAMPRSVTIPVNCAGSVGSVGVNPTASATVEIHKNGVLAITVNITTGGVVTFVNASPVSLVAGDVLTFVGQALADATLADISLTVVGSL